MNLSAVQTIILDVDGVLTDGTISPGLEGDADKRFHVRDGATIKTWQRAGGVVGILSGRRSESVARRAAELGIEVIRQGVRDKSTGLSELLSELDQDFAATAYVGDDLPDLPAMSKCAMAVAVADAAPAVKRMAHVVTQKRGGEGAIAEFIEWLMRKQGRWSQEAVGCG